MPETKTIVQTKTKTLIGVALMSAAGLAAAAGFVAATAGGGAAILNINTARVPNTHFSVQGAKDEPMLGVMMQAKNKDILIKELKFNVIVDLDADFSSVENDLLATEQITSCVLKNNQTGSVVSGPVPIKLIDNGAPANNENTVTFVDEFTLGADTNAVFKVHCDIANSTVRDQYAIAFELRDDSAVIAEKAGNGEALTPERIHVEGTSDAGVNVDGAIAVFVNPHGRLTAAVAPSSPSADILTTGSSQAHVATYQFTARQEAFTINTLSFFESQAAVDTGVAFSDAYANNIGTVSISYPLGNGTTGTNSAVLSGNRAKIDTDLHIPAGETKEVMVYVTVPQSERKPGGTATSNEKIAMGLFSDASSDSFFKATGETSGDVINDDEMPTIDMDPFSSDHVAAFIIRETKPTFTLSSQSPSGNTTPGRAEALRFDVSANANEAVVLSQIMFRMISTANGTTSPLWNECSTDNTKGVSTDDFDLYNLTVHGMSNALDAGSTVALFNNDGVPCTNSVSPVDFVRYTFGTPQIIPKGTTYTYSLVFDSTGASVTENDIVRFEIAADPIPGTYQRVADAVNVANWGITAALLPVDSSAVFSHGDVIVLDADDNGVTANDERLFVNAKPSNNQIYVLRGYMGSQVTPASRVGITDDIYRLPGTLLWQDDGTASTSVTSKEYFGSYLVKGLTLVGNLLVF